MNRLLYMALGVSIVCACLTAVYAASLADQVTKLRGGYAPLVNALREDASKMQELEEAIQARDRLINALSEELARCELLLELPCHPEQCLREVR